MPWYRSGTVAITAGQTTVTGTGTAFALNARVGDAFQGPDGRWYEVTNIASATVLSILPAYQGATVSGGAYGLAPMQGYVKESADRLRQLVDQWGATLAGLGTVSVENIVPLAKGGTGASTAAGARSNLGLGTAATATLTASSIDTTAGRALKVGDFGLGHASGVTVSTSDLDSTTLGGGTYRVDIAAGQTFKGLPAGAYAIWHQRLNTGVAAAQIAMLYNTSTLYMRAGTTADFKKMVSQSDIVGTVSQASGAPTGAIIERGSNANGEYVRNADGTQICWGSSSTASFANAGVGSIFVSDPITMTFPVPFAASPTVVPKAYRASGSIAHWAVERALASTSSVSLAMLAAASGVGGYLGYVAAGRWY